LLNPEKYGYIYEFKNLIITGLLPRV